MHTKTAGMVYFLAGAILLMGIITAQIFYPVTYSTSQNMISNLGATPPPDSIVREPSAAIFDSALILAGLFILIGTYFLHKGFKNNLFTFAAIVMGMGTAGVGVFPAYHVIAHPIVALLAFVGGGISAICSAKVTKPPFSFLAIILGCINLSFLGVGLFLPHDIVPILGRGGTERWVAYPIVLWLTGFGGYLMNYQKKGK